MKMQDYIKEFNENDIEYIKTDIENDSCQEWLESEIPVFECSDKILEKAYYFRWWTYRKHVRNTPEGYIITEFLPNVPWSGIYNVINAPAGHHIMEGRWLRNAEHYLTDYINVFFNHPEEGMRYSSWTLWAAERLNDVKECVEPKAFLRNAIPYYKRWEDAHKTETGLFWSTDDMDAMEFSLSGTPHGNVLPGLRPTLNSYMYGDALAIYDFSVLCGTPADEYKEKADKISKTMQKLLCRDGFFKALHPRDGNFSDVIRMDTKKVPRELIGYIPWYFSIPEEGDEVFKLLEDKNVFLAKQGLTTVEQNANGFLCEYEHECLWNGYVWPFSTSQTLTALLNVMLKSGKNKKRYSEMFFRLLHQYARQHTRKTETGKEVMWIDEVMSPYEHVWTSREKLKNWSWKKELGGIERGKDYNHSTFCDIIISALTGFAIKNGEIMFEPIIPKEWDYFSIDNLFIKGSLYRIEYGKTDEHYGKVGLSVYKNGKKIK